MPAGPTGERGDGFGRRRSSHDERAKNQAAYSRSHGPAVPPDSLPAGGGIELDDVGAAASGHHAAKLMERRLAIAHVTDRADAHGDVDRATGQGQGLGARANGQGSIRVAAATAKRCAGLDGDDREMGMGGAQARSEGTRPGADVENSAG